MLDTVPADQVIRLAKHHQLIPIRPKTQQRATSARDDGAQSFDTLVGFASRLAGWTGPMRGRCWFSGPLDSPGRLASGNEHLDILPFELKCAVWARGNRKGHVEG